MTPRGVAPWIVALVVVTGVPASAEQPAPEEAPVSAPREAPAQPGGPAASQIAERIAAGRFGVAALRCERALARDEAAGASPRLREVCARAYLGLGDKLAARGARAAAEERWARAVSLDPSVWRERASPEGLDEGSRPEDGAAAPRSSSQRNSHEHTPPDDAGEVVESAPLGVGAVERRFAGRGLEVALALGFDGLAALVVGWMSDEGLAIELSVGLVYPVVDTRVRWYGAALGRPFSPVVGLGMTTPFDHADRAGLDIGSYNLLYELGETFHLDLGLAWELGEHWELFGGVAFVTPFAQDDIDAVLFFPEAAAQLSWWF